MQIPSITGPSRQGRKRLRMLFLTGFAILLVGLIINTGSSVLAQDAAPVSSPVAGEMPLDLVAMVLLPALRSTAERARAALNCPAVLGRIR